jgi:hypothetical protein
VFVASEKEVLSVRSVLERDWPDGTPVEDVAKAVIKALDATRGTTWRPIGPPLKVGEGFKSIISSSTHFVAWIGEDGGKESAWIVDDKSLYGSITRLDSPFWKWTSPVKQAKPVTRRVKVQKEVLGPNGEHIIGADGMPLFEDVVEERTSTPTWMKIFVNKLGMTVGDRVTLRQDGQYAVEAVFSGGVLLRSRQSGMIYAEENGNLEKYYTDGWGKG